jgi:hypothetical protein
VQVTAATSKGAMLSHRPGKFICYFNANGVLLFYKHTAYDVMCRFIPNVTANLCFRFASFIHTHTHTQNGKYTAHPQDQKCFLMSSSRSTFIRSVHK